MSLNRYRSNEALSDDDFNRFLEANFDETDLEKKFLDPTYLPSHSEIAEAFRDDPKDPFDPKRQAWSRVVENRDNPVFEFLNKEFIDSLGNYLFERINSYQTPQKIIEICAGNGRLSYFLNKKLESLGSGQKIIATGDDIGPYMIKPLFPVDKVNHKDALAKYNPNIVICSWMPLDTDLTPEIRTIKNVNEYIIIGEPAGGACGTPEVWAHHPGFKEFNLEDIHKTQICRTDSGTRHKGSYTYSFRRE